MKTFVVAEVSKNWPNPDATPVSAIFEEVIAVNHRRGYRLMSFQLHRMMVAPGALNETIIAVFELAVRPENN